MQTSENRITILVASDDRYCPIVSVSLLSLVRNSKHDVKIYIACFRKYEKDVKRCIDVLYNDIAHLNLMIDIKIEQLVINEEDYPMFVMPKETSKHITASTFIRLLMPSLIPEDKCIYLDCDTIILSDLWELFKVSLEDNYIAGVSYDRYYGDYKYTLGISKDSPYVNAGVLLYNLKQLRKDNVEKDFIRQITKLKDGKLVCADQDIINFVCQNKILRLDFRFNFIPKSYCYEDKLPFPMLSNCVVLHFADVYKPWNSLYIPYKWAFWENCLLSSYSNKVWQMLFSHFKNTKISRTQIIKQFVLSKISIGKEKRKRALMLYNAYIRINTFCKFYRLLFIDNI